MVIPIELLVLVLGAMVSFQAWIAVKVIDQGRKLVELESKIGAQEKNCAERLHWMRELEKTLMRVADDTLVIRTKMEDAESAK